MRLQDFGVLADENVHPAVVGFLRRQGFDVLDIKESPRLGATDAALLQIARSENRIAAARWRPDAINALGSRESARKQVR